MSQLLSVAVVFDYWGYRWWIQFHEFHIYLLHVFSLSVLGVLFQVSLVLTRYACFLTYAYMSGGALGVAVQNFKPIPSSFFLYQLVVVSQCINNALKLFLVVYWKVNWIFRSFGTYSFRVRIYLLQLFWSYDVWLHLEDGTVVRSMMFCWM